MEFHEIKGFWLFFETIAFKILDNPENPELINSLDNEIDKLGELSWEYGPLDGNTFYFCLSPNFRFDLIPYTEFAISLAPSLSNWTFVSGKPKKSDCVEEFSFVNEDGMEDKLTTKNWYAVVFKFKDGTYDIDFTLDANYSEETSYLALDTALANLLGEIYYMRKVNV